ncbi:MAG: hypothetical protein LRZ94_01355 [Candidatus Pacebacteria bacterium]|nr:hypothetical protein [Candidatus Paceibacterota bacterium]
MKRRGSALYFSLIVLTIILGIVLGLSTIIINQIQIIRGMEYSVIAFYAADSANERALNVLFRTGNFQDFTGSLINNSTYSVQMGRGLNMGGPTHSCVEGFYCIRATGDYLGVRRGIKTGN